MASALTGRSEQEVFVELERLCASAGYIHALASMAVRDSMVIYSGAMTPEYMAASYDPARTIRTEFTTLLGLLLKQPIDFAEPSQDELQGMLTQTQALLKELHECLNRPMMEAIIGSMKARDAGLDVTEDSVFGRGDVLREPIFYGGESAYSFQYLDFALERYRSDNAWLKANKGFEIEDAHAVVRAVGGLPSRKLAKMMPSPKDREDKYWLALPGFTMSEEDIVAESGVAREVARAVMDAFTAPNGPTNGDFQSLDDFNLATAFPIILAPDGGYISLQSYGLYEALYDSPFYWMHADSRYRAEASKHRGAFTEEFVARRLTEVFGATRVRRGVTVKRGSKHVTDVDVLVTFADRALVVQCKSKKLTLEARRGNDLQLRDDFKKSVQDAYDQAHLSAQALSDTSIALVDADGVEIKLPLLRTIYPICVVSDHYPALTVQARNFLEFTVDNVIRAPLVSDIFLVDVMAEMLGSPLRLLSYIDRRVTYTGRLSSISEHAILGFHLSQNLWFDDEYTMVMIDDQCAVDLDTAMTVRREGVPGSPIPDGILTRFDGTTIGRVIASIEHRESLGEVNLGFLLLTLSEDTLKELGSGLEAVAARTRKDGKMHDFTHVFEQNPTGITVHCSPLPNSEAIAYLRGHCERRKYYHRADSWFGLLVRRDDGLPKLGFELRLPWKRDEALERATAHMNSVGNTTQSTKMRPAPFTTTKKVGPNEPCVCGSGKKYKKCCRS